MVFKKEAKVHFTNEPGPPPDPSPPKEENGASPPKEEKGEQRYSRMSVANCSNPNMKDLMDFEKMTQLRSLPNDTFSMFIFTPSIGSHICAIIVFIVQLILYFLIFFDTVKNDDFHGLCKDSPEHRTTQFIAIMMAVLTQFDIRTSINQWRDGYDETLIKAFEGIARWKWILSSLLRFINGSASLAVSFFLILTTESVLDLLLNFMAIEVISNLDDLVFDVGKEGYFGKPVQWDIFMISESKYYVSKVKSKRLNLIIMLIIWFSMSIFWGVYSYSGLWCHDSHDD